MNRVPAQLATVPNLQEHSLEPQHVVYFLALRGQVVYVGAARCLSVRLVSHKQNKTFDQVFYVQVPTRKAALKLESQFIERLCPRYNLNGCSERKQQSCFRPAKDVAEMMALALNEGPMGLNELVNECCRYSLTKLGYARKRERRAAAALFQEAQ